MVLVSRVRVGGTVFQTSHDYSISALSELLHVAQRDPSLGRKKMIWRTLPTGYILCGGGPEGRHAVVTVAFVLSITMTSTLP